MNTPTPIASPKFLRLFAVTCLLSFAARAAIIVDSFDDSGVIDPGTGNATGSFNYTNNSNFMVVTVGMGAKNGGIDNAEFTTPSVSYGGDALSSAYVHTADHGFSFIFYLSNPKTGENSLSVDFGKVLDPDNNTDRFQFGALSLSNVDLANPVALSYGSTPIDAGNHDVLSDPDLNSGDFLVWGMDAINSVDNPNYEVGGTDAATQDGTSMTVFYEVLGDNGGSGRSQSLYHVLTAGDFDVNGDVLVDAFSSRSSSLDGGVVFNVIPEPGTLTLTLMALVGCITLGTRRRG